MDKLIFGHIFQLLYFANLFKIRNLKKLSLLKGGNAEWSVACDDGIFIFPKECRTQVRSTFFSEKSSEGVLNPSYYNKPYYARKTPPSSKTVVFESTSP